jgi:hypothetical protein
VTGLPESEIKSAQAAIGTSAGGKRGDLANLRDFDRLQTFKDDKDPSTSSSPSRFGELARYCWKVVERAGFSSPFR